MDLEEALKLSWRRRRHEQQNDEKVARVRQYDSIHNNNSNNINGNLFTFSLIATNLQLQPFILQKGLF